MPPAKSKDPLPHTNYPYDKLRGDICWAGTDLDDGIKIYYEAELFGEGAVVWIVE